MSDPVLPMDQSADCSDIPDECSVIPPAKKRSRSANSGRDELNLALASACRQYTAAVNASQTLSPKQKLGATLLLTKLLLADDTGELKQAIQEAGHIIEDCPPAGRALNLVLTNKSLALI